MPINAILSGTVSGAVSTVFSTIWNQSVKLIGDELPKLKQTDRALGELERSREEALNLLLKLQPSSTSKADKLSSLFLESEELIGEIANEIHRLPKVIDRLPRSLRKIFILPLKIVKLQEKMDEIIADLEKDVESTQHIKTSPPKIKLNLIGRDSDVQFILEKLTCSEKYGSNNGVSIVGMRGVGKTALANHILNDREVKAKFPLILQASLFNEEFSVDELIPKLQVVHCEERLNGNGQGDDLLKCDKWLLMLDDLQKVSPREWGTFQAKFLTPGRKILTTTLSLRVGRLVQTTLRYLRPLSQEDCQNLIVHGIDAVQRCQPEPSTCIDLAKKSCGLPLLATFIAETLFGFEEEDGLFKHEALWKWPEINKETLPILKSSFMSLKLERMRCVIYFSLFPHDYEFCQKDLIHMWIGARLVEPHASVFESNGQSFFNELLERSIVQPQDDSLTRYKIHKFTHDLAQMLGSKAYVRCDDERMFQSNCYEWDKSTRHLSLSSNKQNPHIPPSLWDKLRDWEELPRLRTLLCFYNRKKTGQIGKIPYKFFDKLSGLKVLALNYTNISDLPNSVKQLKHLRYLNISNTNIEKLPEKLTKLSALKILKIRTQSAYPEISPLPQLPVEFTKLTNLAIIDWKENDIEKMPSKLSNIGSLVNLRTLPLFIVDDRKGHRITELKDMNHLAGSIKITNLDKIADEAEAKEAMLSYKSSLQKLVLVWKHNVSVAEEVQHNVSVAKEVLRGLKPHDQLKELRIVNYCGAIFPQWLSHTTKLQKLELVGCQSCCNLPTIEELPDLKHLHLEKMSNISNFFQITGAVTSDINWFRSLEELELRDMAELQEWNELRDMAELQQGNELEIKIMPSLRVLKIVNCPKLKSLPSFLYRSKNLVQLEIENCDLLKDKCQDGGEHWSNIKHISEVHVDGFKMPTTPAQHIPSQDAENHNTFLQATKYITQMPPMTQLTQCFGRLWNH